MNVAIHVPSRGRAQAGAGPGPSRQSLRRKGLVLFLAVSAYVVAGAVFLTWQGAEMARSRPDEIGWMEAAIWVALAVLVPGLALFGAFLTRFVGRLATDLGRLQARALEVAGGLRGAPLGIERDDEVGTLAHALDRLSADLQAREAEIAAARLEQFHNERMTLLGGIAAGLAHEIGNPVAALAAIASAARADPASQPAAERAAQLLALTERLSAITRRLAVIAGLRSREVAPVALNSILETVAALVALDRRFQRIEIVAELDAALPAVLAAEDDIVQLLLHLLVNAAEAFEGADPALPRITLSTLRDGSRVHLVVGDNGRGMDRDTLERAIEPLFTTKPAGRGNGLGLDACRRIVERHGGAIRLESAIGRGTAVRCMFPVLAQTGRTAM